MSVFALIALAAFASDDPADGVITTAPAGSTYVATAPLAQPEEPAERAAHNLTTQEQIDAYLAAGRAADQDPRSRDRFDDDLAALPSYDRRTHVEAGYAFGSHGYQAYHASVIAPLGDNVTVGFSYSKSEGGIRPGYGYGYRPYGAPIAAPRSQIAPAGEQTSVGASVSIDWGNDDPAPRRGARLR